MNDLEPNQNRQSNPKPPFLGPTRGDLERHQCRAFVQLLEAWLQTTTESLPTDDYRLNVAGLVADAKAALERGSTPYITLLLIVAPAFLSSNDRELEVLGVEDD